MSLGKKIGSKDLKESIFGTSCAEKAKGKTQGSWDNFLNVPFPHNFYSSPNNQRFRHFLSLNDHLSEKFLRRLVCKISVKGLPLGTQELDTLQPAVSQTNIHSRPGFFSRSLRYIQLLPLKSTFKIKEGKNPPHLLNTHQMLCLAS